MTSRVWALWPALSVILAGHLVEALPKSLYVSGATGRIEVVNGRYDIDDEVQFGANCYKKQHVLLWICRDPHNLWSFQPLKVLGTPQGLLISTQKGSDSPLRAGPWREWQEEIPGYRAGSWIPTEAKVEDIPQGWGLDFENMRQVTLRQTVAGMLFGSLILSMLVLGLLSSADIQVRSYSYRLLSCWMTFLISFLLVRGIWDLLTLQLLPAPPPQGLGFAYPVKPGIRIVLSFAIFTSCYCVLNFLGWKVQYSRPRLMVLKTLGAHITACWGIVTFTTIQHEAVFAASCQFEGPLLSAEATRGVICFLTVIAAWCTFAIYRWASLGARQELFKNPPTAPWPPAPPAPVMQTVARVERGCLGASAPVPVMPTFSAPKPPNWGILVDEGEDEGAVVTIGFLFAQAIIFCRAGELPGIESSYKRGLDSLTWLFFLITLLVLAVIFFGILAIRSKRGPGGRPGKVLQRTCAMTITWVLYRAACRSTRTMFTENRELSLVIASFFVTVTCFVIIVVTDKILDKAMGRNSTPARFSWFHQSSGVHLSESVMRAVNCCLGLVMALSWQLNVEESVQTFVESEEILSEHLVVSKCIFCILLALGMILPWRRTLLPKSEMRESSHEEEIQHELLELEKAESYIA
mmetsp:Transcript_42727/g.91656  ORF Transcript_42727/g.91656 Transcript_42727/m.91656 type:complete len:635 (-) Transcript_42727:58-1962(-)